ncbi:hypothetical protein L6452_18321 [Arctium lappa]|uniref:Uncharacterized protein n=1 Tax=Arctium lappa TaxID=4217 RepID=A0ACB9C5T6_ARCLA|nr:hypothetical protein L6452_18321 [Arctium lappa]
MSDGSVTRPNPRPRNPPKNIHGQHVNLRSGAAMVDCVVKTMKAEGPTTLYKWFRFTLDFASDLDSLVQFWSNKVGWLTVGMVCYYFFYPILMDDEYILEFYEPCYRPQSCAVLINLVVWDMVDYRIYVLITGLYLLHWGLSNISDKEEWQCLTGILGLNLKLIIVHQGEIRRLNVRQPLILVNPSTSNVYRSAGTWLEFNRERCKNVAQTVLECGLERS